MDWYQKRRRRRAEAVAATATLVLALVLALTPAVPVPVPVPVRADFSYAALHSGVLGLQLLGSAAYSTCPDTQTPHTVVVNTIENTQSLTVTYLTTERGRNQTQSALAVANSACSPALRLTTSIPQAQAGAVWHAAKQSVVTGFDTSIRVRLWQQSQVCEVAVDKDDRRTLLYDTCAVASAEQDPASRFGAGAARRYVSDGDASDMFVAQHTKPLPNGGHGLALAVQNSAAGTSALGGSGAGLGVMGVPNSVAVLLDTVSDFISHDRFTACFSFVFHDAAGAATVLTTAVCRNLTHGVGADPTPGPGAAADWPTGTNAHDMRVVLWPTQRADLSQTFFAAPALAGLLVGSTNVQTLCVHWDDLTDLNPVLCVPVDLSKWLTLTAGKAFVGVTAATAANAWQRHDISSWSFCQTAGCS